MNGFRLALLALILQNPQQPAPAPARPAAATASVEGIIVKLGTNDGIPGADLELTLQSQSVQPGQGTSPIPPYTATSGADGKFSFRNISAGNYKLVAARIGGSFTPVEYGQRGLLGRGVTFPISNGEQKKDVRLEMAPVGSITGRIVDSDNRPVGHAAVMALAPIYRRGERILTMLALVHSDDHGEFRLFSLAPGRYYVAARLEDLTRRSVPLGYYPPGRMLTSDRVESPVVIKRTLPTGDAVEETYQIMYYGSGTNPDRATPVNLGPGATVAGVDIPISAGKVPSLHIRGKVTASDSGVSAGSRVVAVPQRYGPDLLVPSGVADANGAFDLAGAVPGKYFLTAVVPPDPNIRTTPPPLPQFGMVSIEVGEKDLDGMSVVASSGFPLSGKISMEGRLDSDPDLAKIRLVLSREPDILGLPNVVQDTTFSSTREFAFRAVPQGDFSVQVTGIPPYAYAKSVRLGALDLLENPLHITGKVDGRIEVFVGTDASTLSGVVMDEHQESSINVQQARAIEIRPGEDIRGISITAGVVRTFHLRGVVANVAGVAGVQSQGRLIPTDPAWPPSQIQIDPVTGKFDVGRVVPGSYILYVRVLPGGAAPAELMWASMPLEVREQDVDNLSVVPRAGVNLPGKVIVDGQPEGGAASAAAGLFLGMRPDPLVTQQAPSPSTRVSGDGTFVLPGVIAGNYRVYVPPLLSPNNPALLGGLPPVPSNLTNSYVKSIRVGGADVLNSGIHLTPVEGLTMEIVLGANAGLIEGRVMHDGKPASDVTVGMLPNAPNARGFRTDMHKTTLTDATGNFQISGLPPGEYKMFAWEEADKDAIMDLDFVHTYEERGTRIEIGDGEMKSVELNVIPARVP